MMDTADMGYIKKHSKEKEQIYKNNLFLLYSVN